MAVAAGVNDLANDSGVLFKFGNRPGILLRTAAGEWRAFSAVCTHLRGRHRAGARYGLFGGTYDLAHLRALPPV